MIIFRFQMGITFYVHANFGSLKNMNKKNHWFWVLEVQNLKTIRFYAITNKNMSVP
jgi:hypothetical protein